jgi:ribosomal protein L11 methyltransferase
MTKSDTIEVIIPAPDDLQEYLIAELLDLDFEGFVQDDDSIRAYIPPPRWDDYTRELVEQWLHAHGILKPIQERVVAPENWNRTWEETIQPVTVDRFLIKPTWAEIPPGEEHRILLEIDPKMSFGTGYHETTRLMLRLLPAIVRPGDRVLDAGTGTGVLAIAALKLGADKAVGFDIDEWAFDNASENALINGVSDRFEVRVGGVEVVSEASVDVILANINLNVLLDMMPFFRSKLPPGGRLILSGVLRTDRAKLLPTLRSNGFELIDELYEAEWWALHAQVR